MPEKRGGVGACSTCDDCYFRQELLCALKVDRICPTFRPTVGRQRKPAAPKQAQLVPFGSTPPVPMAPAAHARRGPEPVPFGAAAAESNFSIQDVNEPLVAMPARELVQQVELPQPETFVPEAPAVPELVRVVRAAAATRPSVVAEVAVPVAGPDEPEQVALPLRLGRVAQRIAQRYPNASFARA